MAAAITDIVLTEAAPNSGLKRLFIQTKNTVDATDTIEIDMADYGCVALLAVNAWVHTTDGSVITSESDTTSVSGTTVTITIAAGTDNDTRVIELIMSGTALTYS